MNFRFTVLETSLNRAEFQWKSRRMLKRLSVLGIVVCGLLLGLGMGIVRGWIEAAVVAGALLVAIGAAGFVGFVAVVITTIAGSPDRHWLALAVERIDSRFLDRLNALLSLEKRRGERAADSFAFRIARQAQQVASEKPAPSPFQSTAPVAWFGGFVVVLLGLALFNHTYAPWQRLKVSQQAKLARAKNPQRPLDLAMPGTNSIEQPRRWGEVRITDPGADLKVTKVDVVPLQIEAASSENLGPVRWLSAVNGGSEVAHDLPPPPEPRYAIYQPTIYLDQFNLSDWDVLTYYAQASTGASNRYASEVYFIEVRPFREDIMKMPGGEGGKPYQAINELTGLIHRQQHIIRETYQHVQNHSQPENLHQQDRKKLAAAESDLAGSVQHLYAQMATGMENAPIGDALDNLAKAQTASAAAAQHLDQNAMPQAQEQERGALSGLVAARKSFHQAISDNPGAFDDSSEPQDEASPVADASSKLNQMAEFRNEAKAAQEFAQNALRQQKDIDQRAHMAPQSQYSALSREERELREQLRNFQQQHPQPFKGSQPEAKEAQKALSDAARALQSRGSDARAATEQATQGLERFAQAMQRKNMDQQLADAYKLKQLLDQQAQSLQNKAQPGSNMGDTAKTARDAQRTVEELKSAAEQEPTRSAFGQPLRDALAGPDKAQLDESLKNLQSAADDQSKRESAGQAAQGLRNLSRAFASSEPKSLQMAQQSDSLKPGDSDSFAQGMAELDSLAKQLQENRQLSGEQQRKQARQALADLQNGLRSQFGDNEQGQSLMAQLEKTLGSETGLEPGNLQKLMDALRRFSVEATEQLARQEDKPDVTSIDPAQLPPAYRGKIQRYFEKLSETR